MILKELDLSQKSKAPPPKGEVESYDIFGLSDWKDNERQYGEPYQRVIMKTNSFESENMSLFVKTSILKK
jgi:hypothetical protein